MKFRLPLFAGLLLPFFLAGCGEEISETFDSNPPTEAEKGYIVLDDSLAQLKQDFNASKGKVRLLFIVGDTCGVCLRGMADLNDAFVARAQADERLLTLVVHVPTLGAEERHVPDAIPLLDGPRVIHYWDGSGISGRHLEQTLETDGVYAWDVWLAYGPGAEWAADVPPAPDFWMHQLGRLPRDLRLDADRFGELTLDLMQSVSASELAERRASEAELLADGTVISSVAQPKGVMVRQHIRGRGGYKAITALQSVTRYGNFTSKAGTTDIEVIQDREGGLVRIHADSGIGLPAEVESSQKGSWEFDGKLVDWEDKGHQVRKSGMRKIGRSLAWKLFLLQSNGMRWALYIDSHTGDLVLQERLDEEGSVMYSVVASDFEEIDGLRLPNTIEYLDSQGRPIGTERYEKTLLQMR